MSDSAASGNTSNACCDYSICEGACCYDGAYLLDGEQQFLLKLVAKHRNRFLDLDPRFQGDLFVVEAFWESKPCGFKTATRPHTYSSPHYPKHFPHTRCIFSDLSGWCRLEILAKEHGKHKWAYKPATCWLFPLSVEHGEAVAPPTCPEEDPYFSKDFPGFASALPCGKACATSWKKRYREEIQYLRKTQSLPILDSTQVD